jgi:hypothetical protein
MELSNIVMPLSLNHMEPCIPIGLNSTLNFSQEEGVECNGPRYDTCLFELAPIIIKR